MSAADWEPVYEDGVPVRMRWATWGDRPGRRCPRTFPHDGHGPWFDGTVSRPGDGPAGFNCPGVEMEATP